MKQSAEQIVRNLRDAGCPEAFIAQLLKAVEEGTPAQRERLLEQERHCILERVHDEQKKLECFDFLCYQLRREDS